MIKRFIILLLSTGICPCFTTSVSAQVDFSITISARTPPPPLPVYVQPACPNDGYLWSPGYWAYTDDGYFWVPGVWVRPPHYGYLWTPAYWGFASGVYGFHPGYWSRHVGFYGGVNYGYGYGGSGYGGGRWEGNSFRYNTAVANVNTTIVHNTYIDKTVIINNTTVTNNRTSYNGGPRGINVRPNPQERNAQRENHVQATPEQTAHMQQASTNRAQFASVNHGKPETVALVKPVATASNSPAQKMHQPSTNTNTNPAFVKHSSSASQSAIHPASTVNQRPSPQQQHPQPQQQHPTLAHQRPSPAQQHFAPQQQHPAPQQQQHPASQQQHSAPQQQQHSVPQQQQHPAPQPHPTSQNPGKQK